MKVPDPNPTQLLWGTHRFTEGDSEALEIGPLRVDLRLESRDLWIAWQRAAPADGRGGAESGEWQRWALDGDGEVGEVVIRPTLQDLPLVVAPEVPFNVAPKAAARIYVSVPLVVAVDLPKGGPNLVELPTVVMSKTWWGDFLDGELGYWLPTSARRSLDPEHRPRHLIACPIQIRNRAVESLHVEKIALRAAHLSVFSAEGRLWSDETRVTYRAEAVGSDINMTGDAPEEASDAELVAPPRMPATRGLRARTFKQLKFISGF